MATYGELRWRALRIVDDAEGTGYESALILDAIRSAHDAILPWFPKLAKTTLAGDGVIVQWTLPTDFFEVQGCVDMVTGEILPEATLMPGMYVGSMASANNWLLYPQGSVSFSKAPTGNVDFYYLATWTRPADSVQDDDPLEPPNHLITGMALYTAAYLILPEGVSITEIRQFATKVDSGNPEHNPVQKAHTYLLQLFYSEMGKLPKQQRGLK